MPELERELIALGDHLDWPSTPDLAQAVTIKLERRRPRRLLLALAVAVLALGIALAVPPARSALLRFFHLRGVTVERVETLPLASGTANLGKPVPRREAERRVGFELVLPPHVEPLRVRVVDGLASVLLLRKGVPLLLSEFRGTGFNVLKKVSSLATNVEVAEVKGRPGLWLSGAPHVLIFRASNGDMEERAVRVTGNVLLWQHGKLTLRLAGNITREDALRLAGSMR